MGSLDDADKLSGSISGGKFHDHKNNYQLLKEDPLPWV